MDDKTALIGENLITLIFYHAFEKINDNFFHEPLLQCTGISWARQNEIVYPAKFSIILLRFFL